MRWYFRDISDDPSEKELTQQDQFNNDEVALAEALVRETIQNSTDARTSKSDVVRVHFGIGTAETNSAHDFFQSLLQELTPHLKSCEIPIPATSTAPRYLVIEDFGTTGLTGSVDEKDEGQFCGFWRRFGRSNKKGSTGGRWGLGKLVFSSSSSIRSVIGLTVRAGDSSPYVMGQAILKNHKIAETEVDSVGFWCDEKVEKRGLPCADKMLVDELTQASGLTRKSETGLSLIIPFLLPDIEGEQLISATLKNYYFPILTGKLIVTVDSVLIDATTFDEVAKQFELNSISAPALQFVRDLQELRDTQPLMDIPKTWLTKPLSADLLGDQVVTDLRERFKTGEMLYFRAPIVVRSKKTDGQESPTHLDLFLKAAGAGERSQTLVVRGSITVPTEGKKASLPDCYAALVADHEVISQFLGDAENPAHTQWNERAEKLRANWNSPQTVLRRVRAVLHEIYALIADRVERDDPLALIDFFSIPLPTRTGPSRKGQSDKPMVFPAPKPKPFKIEKRTGGFSILPSTDQTDAVFPLSIRLRCAYDVLNGNAFRRFSDDDFSFYKGKISIEKTNADCWPAESNEMDVVARSKDFRIDVFGFDPNRDLIVEAQS